MPVPSAITDLSTTLASNSPAGSDNVFPDLDNYLRAHAQFVALLRDGRGLSTEVSLASAATCDIGGAASMFVQITGTTTITSFGTNYLPRILRFAGVLTLTHNATTLILPTGANITTAAGDMCLAVPVGTSGWRVLQYQRASEGADFVSFLQAGTGASSRTVQSKLRDVVSVLDFGAVGDGSDATAAFIAAAATGKPLHIPYGDYVISAPVTISSHLIGQGADDGQSIITLTSAGQLIVGDWHAHWDGFFIRSAVNSKKFIVVPGISYFKCTNFRAEKIGAATGQVAIEFDTTTASVYFNNIDNFKIKVDYPFNITGNSTQVFNANKIGTVATGYYQDFQSAIAIGGVLACDANQFAGYFEVGVNAVNHTAGALRQNRFNLVLDAVTRAYNTSVTVTDPNIWEILDGGFTTAGTYPQNQILIGPPLTKVRATNATADSIPNASATVLKFDAEVYDTLSEFVNGTGVFTARNAGYYSVDAAALSASVAWDAGERWEIRVYKNGTEYAKGDWNAADAATTRQRSSRVVTTVFMNGTTDTLDVRVIHNQGGTVALDTSPTGNYIDIARLP